MDIDLTHNYYQFQLPIDLVYIDDNKHNKVMENNRISEICNNYNYQNNWTIIQNNTRNNNEDNSYYTHDN